MIDKAQYGFIRVSDGTRFKTIWTWKNTMKFLLWLDISLDILFYARIKFDSYDSLPLERPLTLHNVIILIKLVFNKYKKITTTAIYF